MKKLLFISALIFAGSAGVSQAQVISTTLGDARVTLPARTPAPAPPLTPQARGGVVPTAVRNGNPLQMLNPRAPARYGNSQACNRAPACAPCRRFALRSARAMSTRGRIGGSANLRASQREASTTGGLKLAVDQCRPRL